MFDGAIDADLGAGAVAPALELDDHRSVGTGPLHGAEAMLRALRALLDLSEGFGARIDDVLASSTDALLVRLTSFGTSRSSGGAYERPILELWAFGADGRIARWERFDPEHEAEALARFDALAETTKARSAPHRVRPNAAEALCRRFQAAVLRAAGETAATRSPPPSPNPRFVRRS